jgi:hypothetical protein
MDPDSENLILTLPVSLINPEKMVPESEEVD